MPQRAGLLIAGVAAVLLTACSGAAPPAPSPSPPPSRSPMPSPSSTPLPPDTLAVGVLGTGIGTFDLAAIPVARLKNEAMFHGAASVIVHFVTHRAGRTLGSLDSAAVNLGPGETLAVTGDCTDACNGATSVAATVTVGSWPTGIGPVFTTTPARYACRPCHAAHGYGDVQATLTPSSAVAAGVAVVGFAVCENSAGVILGGGSEQFVWQAGSTLSADIPVVLNAAPSSCSLGASTGW
ncbi:MAG: hypothetical protein ACYDCS_12480 [Candidatus Dormibacteria bacterium]